MDLRVEAYHGLAMTIFESKLQLNDLLKRIETAQSDGEGDDIIVELYELLRECGVGKNTTVIWERVDIERQVAERISVTDTWSPFVPPKQIPSWFGLSNQGKGMDVHRLKR
ncbi:hypothetical protein PIB30_045217 [Stylosanthes scabra]|uniref:Uncharacterized protein n=1 Tax=Stylosanthes scabra TaxID=79078 RepID=A0ABU6TFS1_9FABA|nr:hypothetical protein [Stylosanthes scabra]